MDSLSQIVLGAAVGEVVLGRRIGNRAMVWGAVAGTIPDMDVLGKFFLSELDNLGFHRGISHSLLFCVLGALAFGWVTHRLYRSQYHAWMAVATKATAAVLIGFVRTWCLRCSCIQPTDLHTVFIPRLQQPKLR